MNCAMLEAILDGHANRTPRLDGQAADLLGSESVEWWRSDAEHAEVKVAD